MGTVLAAIFAVYTMIGMVLATSELNVLEERHENGELGLSKYLHELVHTLLYYAVAWPFITKKEREARK